MRRCNEEWRSVRIQCQTGALLLTGDEDVLTGPPEAELMRQNIAGSEMKIIRRAGHYSPWEQPAEVGQLLRKFFDSVYGA